MVNFISSEKLAALIKSDKVPRTDYLVVDVRDDDWAGGHIKNSEHLPSRKFHSRVVGLVESARDVPTVVFHCAYSQVRGPKAARIYHDTRAQILKDGQAQEVLVLSGGFAQFQTKFKDDADLVENWDPAVWNGDWD